jgi:hypothetical protein
MGHRIVRVTNTRLDRDPDEFETELRRLLALDPHLPDAG